MAKVSTKRAPDEPWSESESRGIGLAVCAIWAALFIVTVMGGAAL